MGKNQVNTNFVFGQDSVTFKYLPHLFIISIDVGFKHLTTSIKVYITSKPSCNNNI